MPIYEYQCEQCGHTFEKLQKMSDPRVRRCPECDGREVERVVSPPAIRFKGSGWYVTDYSDKGKKRAEEAGKEKPADSGDKSEGKAKKGSKAGGESD